MGVEIGVPRRGPRARRRRRVARPRTRRLPVVVGPAPGAARSAATAILLGSVLLLATAPPAAGQGVRGWAGTTVQAVELRPVAPDTLDPTRVEERDGRFFFEGEPVTCLSPTSCLRYRTLAEETSIAATQDVSVTAWGFGVQGLSLTTRLRGRTRVGSDLVWPRSDDEFDLMLGYAQWVRGALRARLGRQEVRSGLGFPAFDGGSVAATLGAVQVQGYAGRSLARGLREPARDVLRGLEDFVPDESVWLLGASARAGIAGLSLTGRYQREILADRSGLESERASLDFRAILPRVRVEGSLDYDFVFERPGKGQLTVAVPLQDGRWLLEASARRYVPYFSLSTIWGFFDPVAYREALVRVGWSYGGRVGAWVSGGYRAYGDAEAAVILEPLRDDGWRGDAGLRWELGPAWGAEGRWSLEWGPGGYLSSGDLAVRWTPREGVLLRATGSSFQQIEQFRLGDGRAWGGGVDATLDLWERTSLAGGWTVMRHTQDGGSASSPWSQSRGWMSVRVRMGEDPGLANRRPSP